jgi:hypothetical protein
LLITELMVVHLPFTIKTNIMTLTNFSTSFSDWKVKKCKKGLHTFNQNKYINKDYAKPVVSCINCNTKKIA